MKEELQSKLVEILASIQAAASKTADFAMEQLPDIAQSYITYGRAANTVGSIFLLFCAIASMVFAWRFGFGNKSAVNTTKGSIFEGDWLPHRVFSAAGGAICAVSMSMYFMSSLTQTLLVWLAPKVWLLKELIELAK